MSFYETVFVTRQDMTEQQVEDLAKNVEERLIKLGNTIALREYWGLRPLAYRIKKNRKGHYVFLSHESDGQCLPEINKFFNFNENVIRYLTMKVDSLTQHATSMMKSRATVEVSSFPKSETKPVNTPTHTTDNPQTSNTSN